MTIYNLSGPIPANGSLYQYTNFRYHYQGQPHMTVDKYTYRSNTDPSKQFDGHIRFGLYRKGEAQATNSLEWGPNELHVTKTFDWIPTGHYATQGRVSVKYLAGGWLHWEGKLNLRD